MGLTQVNSQIRSEFRPAWLSTHKIPLSVLPQYLKAFFPTIKSSTSPKIRKKLESQYSPSGSLRLWLRESELVDANILSILRHAVRFPNSSITVEAMAGVSPDMVASIQALISNTTKAWVHDVGNNKITQVRVMAKKSRSPWLRIVIKERFALEWMKSALTKEANSHEYLKGLGLRDMADTWKVSFGVDYS